MIERKGTRQAYCLDGAGAQIFEDDHCGWSKFLAGEKMNEDDRPWDYDLGSREDFLKKVDPMKVNQKIVTDLRLLNLAERE